MKLTCVTCGRTEEADNTIDLVRLAAQGWDTDPKTCPDHPSYRVATLEEHNFSMQLERMKARGGPLTGWKAARVVDLSGVQN